jgi:hypothetical protein
MMYFADTVTDALTNSGLPGVAVFIILGLIAIIVYQARQNDVLRKRVEFLQDTRVTEAKEINDKLSTPMKEQTDLSKKIYDVLLNINNKRGR